MQLMPQQLRNFQRHLCTGRPAATCAVLPCCRLVDPSDPSKIFLTQPVSDEDRLPSAPVYASNYGQDEVCDHPGSHLFGACLHTQRPASVMCACVVADCIM
jgi:hypothetical protein